MGRLLGAPPGLRRWLDEPGSLTRRLRRHCGDQFCVRVLHTGWGRPWPDEARRLGIPFGERVWVREVILGERDRPWLHARSIIPAAALRGPLRRLRDLGSRPLGSVLFGRYPVRRGAIEVARLDRRDGLHRLTAARVAVTGGTLWARRSVFAIAGRGLLVTEVFLPALLEAATSEPAHDV
jgi:chorismate--pyruvate lyase